MTKTLTPEVLQRMHAYWRAANYLSVGQIYLYDNPLLKEPLSLSHVKPLVVEPLGHDSRPELHLRALEPGYPEIRPQRDLHRRPRSRRSGAGGQHVPRRHLQRDLSERQPGRGRAEEAVHPVFVPWRHLQPRGADDAGVDPRRGRAGVLAQPRLRSSIRQPRADRGMRDRRRRSGDGPAGYRLAVQQVPERRDRRRGPADSPPQRLQDQQPDRPGAHRARGTGAIPARLRMDALLRRGSRAGGDASAHGGHTREGHRGNSEHPEWCAGEERSRSTALADDRPPVWPSSTRTRCALSR